MLKDITLDQTSKDSIAQIEKRYRNAFRGYANAARRLFEDAKLEDGPPDLDEMDRLSQDARKLQDQEYAELRQLVPKVQRPKAESRHLLETQVVQFVVQFLPAIPGISPKQHRKPTLGCH